MDNEYKNCIIIKKGASAQSHERFLDIEEGDTVFSRGEPYIVTIEAHYSGDASYDGYLLYADRSGDEETAESFFPEDLD